MDAPFSIPHIFAMITQDRPASADWLLQVNIDDPTVQRIAEKVAVTTDEEAEELFANSQGKILLSNVRVETAAGESFTRRVLYPKGTPHHNPMTESDILHKFNILANGTGDALLLESLLHLEEVEHISQLMTALAASQ
jgi:2-methylcitrate dehydratase PrpD